MPSDYKEIIQFHNKVGAPTRQRGIKVGDYLVVSYTNPYVRDGRYRIYSIASGKPVVSFQFNGADNAREFADFLDSKYREFWILLEEYPSMDIPQVCMWTIKNGIRIYEAMRKLVLLTSLEDKDTITLDDLNRAYEAAQGAERDYGLNPQVV